MKIRGHRIELGEVEQALRQHTAIHNAVVVSREHMGSQELVAYLVCEEEIGTDLLRAWTHTKLPEFMVPAAFLRLRALPLTASGKIDRRALTRRRVSRAYGFSDPATPLERTLFKVWSEIVGSTEFGVDDNFFEAGGNSLRLVEAHARISAELNRVVDVAALFQHPTIRALATFLDSANDEPARTAHVQERARKQRERWREKAHEDRP